MTELEEIDRLLRCAAGIDGVLKQVLRDVNDGEKRSTGRDGLTADQVLRLGILRKRHGLTHRELSEATFDSQSMRWFLNLECGAGLSKSAIHANLKRVKDSTWEAASVCVLRHAHAEGLEHGEVVRGDTTAVETNVHYPTDASLLNDSVRVLCRLLSEARRLIGDGVVFTNHRRRAKAKLRLIHNVRGEEKRHPLYLELIRVAKENLTEAVEGVLALKAYTARDELLHIRIDAVRQRLETYVIRVKKVVDQAYRRVVKKENVPASDKIVSIFEEHTDIIVKGVRDTVFGHKVMVTTGVSGMVLTLRVLNGNPTDSTLVSDTLEDLQALYGKAPTAMAFDGCFASVANRDAAKAAGVEDVTFCKNGNMKLSTLVSSTKLNRLLRNFRAGIEGCISFLKRTFGFSRVIDRSLETFNAALHMGAFAYNITLLARMSIAARSSA